MAGFRELGATATQVRFVTCANGFFSAFIFTYVRKIGLITVYTSDVVSNF